MQVIAPVVRRLERHRARTASGSPRWARWRPGLAHELNNPAAAAQRAADQLAEALDVINGALRRFVESGIEREEAAQLLALHQQALDGAAGRTALDALDAADAEDALLEALEDLGVPEPWQIAEPLAAAGVDEAWLRAGRASSRGRRPEGALRWVAATLTAGGPRRRAQGLHAAHVRASSARSRRTPTWTAAGSSRSTCTRAWRARS